MVESRQSYCNKNMQQFFFWGGGIPVDMLTAQCSESYRISAFTLTDSQLSWHYRNPSPRYHAHNSSSYRLARANLRFLSLLRVSGIVYSSDCDPLFFEHWTVIQAASEDVSVQIGIHWLLTFLRLRAILVVLFYCWPTVPLVSFSSKL